MPGFNKQTHLLLFAEQKLMLSLALIMPDFVAILKLLVVTLCNGTYVRLRCSTNWPVVNDIG